MNLAQLINERFAKLQASTRTAVPATVLALVALELADELFESRRQVEQVRDESARAVAQAEQHAREIEHAARLAVVDALSEIERALQGDEHGADQSGTG